MSNSVHNINKILNNLAITVKFPNSKNAYKTSCHKTSADYIKHAKDSDFIILLGYKKNTTTVGHSIVINDNEIVSDSFYHGIKEIKSLNPVDIIYSPEKLNTIEYFELYRISVKDFKEKYIEPLKEMTFKKFLEGKSFSEIDAERDEKTGKLVKEITLDNSSSRDAKGINFTQFSNTYNFKSEKDGINQIISEYSKKYFEKIKNSGSNQYSHWLQVKKEMYNRYRDKKLTIKIIW